LALLLSFARGAEWADRVGKEPPGGDTTWLRTVEGTSYEMLLGRVLVLVYWSPTRERVRDDLFLMAELHERIYRRGGRVLALTEAPAEAVKPLLAEEDVFFAVGAGTVHSGMAGSELPYAFIVGPESTVLWQGPLSAVPAKTLETALRRAKPFALPRLHDMHEKNAKLYGKGKLFEAACEARFMAEFAVGYFKGNQRRIDLITADAKYIVDRVEAYRAYWWRLVEEGLSRSDFDQALYALEEIRLHLAGEYFKAADYGIRAGDDKVASRRRDEIRKGPLVDRGLKASKSLAALIATQEAARLTEEAKAQLLARFAEFQREWDGTYAARRAARRAKWLAGQPTEPPRVAGG
jgi:hypothetical protein